MVGLSFLVGLSAVCSCWIPLASSVVPPWLPLVAERATGSLDTFIASEHSRALQGVVDNIGAGGSKVPGAEPGLVVASPSKEDPNCRSLSGCTLQLLQRTLYSSDRTREWDMIRRINFRRSFCSVGKKAFFDLCMLTLDHQTSTHGLETRP